MVKKLFLLLALALPAAASMQAGSWKVHPFYVASSVQNMVDTHSKVYYLVGSSLYSYDKTTGASESLNASGRLSDVTVTGLYYNHASDYVLLTYDNSNIDVILTDGRVVNMPELKDAVVPQSKVINNVTFASGKAYVATAFGYVVIDDSQWAITETRYYGRSFYSITQVGNKLVASYGPNVRIINITANRDKYTNFPTVGLNFVAPVFTPIDDTHFFCNSSDSLMVVTINGDYYGYTTVARAKASSIQRTPTGFVANFPSAGYYVTTDATGGSATTHAITGEMVSCSPKGDGTYWAMGANGLHQLDDDNTINPDGIGIATNAFWATYNPGDQKFYLASTTGNAILTNANQGAKTEIWSYDGNQWQDVTPADVPLWNGGQANYQGNYELRFVPGTTNQYVCATWAAGIMSVVDNKVANKYYYTNNNAYNIPILDKYRCTNALDTAGNLWLVESYKNLSKMVAVLPHDKLVNPSETVTASDWITPSVSGLYVGSFKFASFVISPVSDIKVFASGHFQKGIVMWDNHGDINNLTPTTLSFSQFKGREGEAITWDNIYCLLASANGDIWVGTNAGVFSFNPTEAFTQDDFTVNHMKALDEDGVSEDYVAGGAQINCMAEDGKGRKFIGTNAEGVYIVNDDGSQALGHFTTNNSSLQADCIYNIAYNEATNSILIVTMNGVCEYFLDDNASATDYSNVTVTPNPVRPDFTGYVTISNLVDNSTVRIVDAQGRVYLETVSQGGTVAWNCCDATGDRVPTGTYTVLAAPAGSTPTAVASFLVIK